VPLVTSLLAAIVRADGDALVLHAGERPYVVAPSGQSELTSRALTLEAMTGMVAKLLPPDARQALDDFGAVQHDLPASGIFTHERFTVVAARGGNDIWIEIRRHRPSPGSEPIARVTAPEPEPELELEPELEPEPEPEPHPAVVLPLARNQVRGEQTVRLSPSLHTAGIDRLLRIAAARGASTLYLMSQACPSIRVDGEISAMEGEAVLSEPDVEALMLDVIPERNRETLRSQAGTEWMCDVPDVGRIRCVAFRDHRGAGGIFRMIPARAISAEQLGLSKEIQGLCAEAEGLVLVTGPRSSGKSTLIAAFVDLINRTRSDHVITLENQITFVHENRGSLVSQREVRGDRNELLLVARAALRENPDVLVIEDFGSPEIVTLALEAAQSGHLVIGALTAHTATDAVDRIIDQTPPERRAKVPSGLAENLRGIVAQVLLRKAGGGRVAAREVLLNTGAVANLIAEGKTSQLPMAIDSGRKHGMVALNDALVAFVQAGIVESREAYRQAADQQGFLALLKRQGIDTSFVERLA
jgi:twitching motility protein PilT